MGKILVIEDDRNIERLIENIFPKENLEIIRATPQVIETIDRSENIDLNSLSPVSREDAFRAFLREEVKKGSWGSIHDKVIGKIERELIGMILEEEKGNQVRTSKRLGINRNTLRKKMKDLQITTRVVTG